MIWVPAVLWPELHYHHDGWKWFIRSTESIWLSFWNRSDHSTALGWRRMMLMSPSHHPWSHAIVLYSVTGSLDPWPHSPRCAVLLILYLSTMSCLTTVPVVQHECIPQAVLGMDIICQAKSGMGKTAVFVLATLHLLKPVQGEVHVVVLCHTRELAFQIQKEYERFSKYLPEIKSRVFYGGIPNCLHPSMHDPSAPPRANLMTFLWTESSFGWIEMNEHACIHRSIHM